MSTGSMIGIETCRIAQRQESRYVNNYYNTTPCPKHSYRMKEPMRTPRRNENGIWDRDNDVEAVMKNSQACRHAGRNNPRI